MLDVECDAAQAQAVAAAQDQPDDATDLVHTLQEQLHTAIQSR